MADFCITAVQYNKDREHISSVKVREERPQVKEIGPVRIVPREFVADLIRLGKASFQTRVKSSAGKWDVGSQVSVLDETFLTTDPNKSKRDNLGELPEF